jgi:N-acetylmuramoyl-L-alanine amidase
MKRIIILMLVCLLAISNNAFANKFAEIESVELVDEKDGSTDEYNVVNLLIDGNDVLADVPAILYDLNGNTRTLVPISFITQKIGAGIKWDGEKKEVTIDHQGNIIVLKIDSAKATVNGKNVDLPNGVPAKLMSYQGTTRTMVPVNFVTQQLGYEIFWEGDTKTVSINRPRQTLTGIRYVDTDTEIYPELRFKVTDEVSMTSFSVDGQLVGGNNSITLDFHNTELDLSVPLAYKSFIIADSIEKIYDVTLESTDTKPGGVRAVVSLGDFRNGEVTYDSSTGEMVVQLINSVKYIDVEEVNGLNAVVIKTTEEPAINVSTDEGVVYVDVINAKLLEPDSAVVVSKHGIDTVAYKQMDDSTIYDAGTRFTRVTISLNNDTSVENVYVETIGSKVVAYVGSQIYGTYNYSRDLLAATSAFGLDLIGPMDVNVNYNESSHSLSFSVPMSDVNNTLELGDQKKEDGLVNRISVTENGSNYDFKVYMTEDTQYQINSKSNQIALAFANNILKNSEFREKLIVIDAGHGGHDPGAVSPNSTKEKDVVLKSSLILMKKLENAGFKVYLTRERDNYVKLYDRAGIANQLDADIFISVHANAAGNSKANGIETLYNPDSSRNNKELALAIQGQLIGHTNAIDRGIVSRPELVVIRETEMDAVLVELGFLSNSSEEIKLLNESYLETCAEAIVDGIIDFVD